jgi:hypothetical protein
MFRAESWRDATGPKASSRQSLRTLITTSVVAVLVATPALAGRGGHGGDREPAGGAFMTSYPEQGSTGIQKYGQQRSGDIPRYYYSPEATGSILPADGADIRFWALPADHPAIGEAVDMLQHPSQDRTASNTFSVDFCSKTRSAIERRSWALICVLSKHSKEAMFC